MPDIEDRLQVGRGVREPDLRERLVSDAVRRRDRGLAARLGLDLRTASAARVRAVLIWQVRAAIDRSTRNQRTRDFLAVAYNLDPGHADGLTDRLAEWGARTGRAVSTLQTTLSRNRVLVVEQLKGELPRPPIAHIEALEQAENEYERAVDESCDERTALLLSEVEFTDLVAASVTPNRGLLNRALIANIVHFAVSGTGTLVLRKTAGFGAFACLFTTRALLADFQAAVGAPGTDRLMSARGRKVVSRIVQDGTVGVAVNPFVGGRSRVGRSWTPEELRAL